MLFTAQYTVRIAMTNTSFPLSTAAGVKGDLVFGIITRTSLIICFSDYLFITAALTSTVMTQAPSKDSVVC